MPTVNEALGGLLENAIQNWKTTTSSLLTVYLAALPLLLANGNLSLREAKWAGIVGIIAKVAVGALQKDSGTTKAKVPGIAGTVLVDSHETPDDPKAKAVV